MKRTACTPFLLLLCVPGRVTAEDAPKEIVPREALVLESVGRFGRGAVGVDAVEAQMLAGTWAAPKAGDTLTPPGGRPRAWQAARAGENGSLSHAALRGGYAYYPISSAGERVMILQVSGHLLAYFNGEPRGGDPYGYGYVHLPVALRKGTNDLLVQGSPRSGAVGVRLVAPKAAAQLDLGDVTLPDLIVG